MTATNPTPNTVTSTRTGKVYELIEDRGARLLVRDRECTFDVPAIKFVAGGVMPELVPTRAPDRLTPMEAEKKLARSRTWEDNLHRDIL
ncbi:MULTISPECIES: hypothetical protein [Nocardia]|uniref:hypothetical protein n=1 Tax=Nocardia TaxID=1817 RepID=UPI002456B465|nr:MULTISPECIES: hypothetical protein [Nocardia]